MKTGKRNFSQGIFLKKRPDLLNPEGTLKKLSTKNFGKNIFYFNSIDSTQDTAKKLEQDGTPEGALVIAEEQTKARGRGDRSWFSPKGGLWFSLLLKPALEPKEIPKLSLVFSLSIAETLEKECKALCKVKWPNDVLLQTPDLKNRFKKVCGILIEMSAESDKVHWAIVGCGVNVNNSLSKDLLPKAVSLKEVLGKKINRNFLLRALLKAMESSYIKFAQEGFSAFYNSYNQKSILHDKNIMIEDYKNKTEGKFLKLDSDGSLILLTAGKELKKFFSGDVSLHS
ncbi:MAG: biotin--[acetyl-CoA-carboxylase] ligase [Elusimicrobia bacterium]|nr:biotin--[acetyl-CoA-carboxylase] ligase [Elusimicrobiota bacterium]